MFVRALKRGCSSLIQEFSKTNLQNLLCTHENYQIHQETILTSFVRLAIVVSVSNFDENYENLDLVMYQDQKTGFWLPLTGDTQVNEML